MAYQKESEEAMFHLDIPFSGRTFKRFAEIAVNASDRPTLGSRDPSMQMTEKIRPKIDPARNMLEVITTLLDKLRPSDRKAAELVLADPRFVLDATLATTARRAGVSEPTVIRFCEAVGCAGFQDFKLRLAQSIALGMPATHSVLSAEDSTSTLADKIFDYTMNTLNWARRRLDKDTLGRAIEILVDSEL